MSTTVRGTRTLRDIIEEKGVWGRRVCPGSLLKSEHRHGVYGVKMTRFSWEQLDIVNIGGEVAKFCHILLNGKLVDSEARQLHGQQLNRHPCQGYIPCHA